MAIEMNKIRSLIQQKLAKSQQQQTQQQQSQQTQQTTQQQQQVQERKIESKPALPKVEVKGVERERVQIEQVEEETAGEVSSVEEEVGAAESDMLEEVVSAVKKPVEKRVQEEKRTETRQVKTQQVQQTQQVTMQEAVQQVAVQVQRQVESQTQVTTMQQKIQQLSAKIVAVGAVSRRRISADDLFHELERVEKKQIKYAILIFGDKDSGKTVAALSFPGRILALSFDGKTERVWKGFYREDKRIHVVNVIEYWDTSTQERVVESAYELYYALQDFLDRYVQRYGEPDWILVDYASTFVELCEAAARYMHGLRTMLSGAQWAVWRERNYLIEGMHNKFMRIARRGVIYTCYPRVSPEEIYDGQIITQRRVPKWLDDMVAKMDIVLETLFRDREKKYVVKVWACKIPEALRPGDIIDVTGKPLWQALLERNPQLETLLFPSLEESSGGES